MTDQVRSAAVWPEPWSPNPALNWENDDERPRFVGEKFDSLLDVVGAAGKNLGLVDV